MLSQFRSLDRPVQVLLLNDFTINLSFYMLYPFLAVYFTDTLGMDTWMVGFILGVRVFCQQGLTLIGGTLSDRMGAKPVIIAGLFLRMAGFGLFGIVGSFSLVLLAAILSGLAGALFSPAARSYLAVAAGDRRPEVFALANVVGRAGMLAGPVLGVLLLRVSFPAVSLTAAALFLALMLAQLRYLPVQESAMTRGKDTLRSLWREVFTNRAFVLFSIAMVGSLTLFNQLYLGLPLEVSRLTGDEAGAGLLFILSAIVTIALQLPVIRFCRARWKTEVSLALGLAVMGLAFLPPLAAQWTLPLDDEVSMTGPLRTAINLSPVIVSVLLLTIGLMITNPLSQEMVPILARERFTGTYFGAFSMAAGLATTLSNTATGFAFDAGARTGFVELPWLLMLALGLASAAAMYIFDRRGEFDRNLPARGMSRDLDASPMTAAKGR
jgi:MFS family permease